jgi:hypothetical protein
MISTREEALTATSPYVIDKQLFLEIAKGPLAEVASRFTKNFVLLDEELMEKFKKAVRLSNVRKQCGRLGGRPRMADLSAEEIDKLDPKERERYKMRIWKRNSRQRSK